MKTREWIAASFITSSAYLFFVPVDGAFTRFVLAALLGVVGLSALFSTTTVEKAPELAVPLSATSPPVTPLGHPYFWKHATCQGGALDGQVVLVGSIDSNDWPAEIAFNLHGSRWVYRPSGAPGNYSFVSAA